ncbi:MAG: DUF2975 domain-containing protein [Neisseriaceae bacterium]|nr:DUF2975 domain-containing protein [Neisseriaceae bacterium]MBP6862608.1 DUF2975 domain-containing protein [Neisseriaceae bacterium]
MKTQKLAQTAKRMALLTLALMAAMLLLNTAYWLWPNLTSIDGGYGFGFGLTDRLVPSLGIDVAAMPWWQTLGAMVISGIPLLVLALGLYQLYLLFTCYARGDYFTVGAALHLGKVGKAVALWVALAFLCEPVLSLWLTMTAPPGQRMVSLSFQPSAFVALFIAASVVMVARILGAASEVADENKQFI